MMGGFGDGEKLLDDECLAGGIPAGGSPAGAPRSGPRDQRLTAFRQGQWADVTRGSGWLALQAGDVSQPEVLAEATDDEVLGIGRAWKALETWTFSRKLGVVRELIRRHPLDERWEPNGLPREWEQQLHHEVAAALAISTVAAGKLVHLAWTLDTLLPGIGQELEDGRLDPPRVRLIVEGTSVLDNELLFPMAERIILDGLPGCKTWSALERLVQRAVLTVDPDGAQRRREKAEREHARLRFWKENYGTCAMQATGLPPDEALAANAHIEGRAHEYRAGGIRHPMDVLRVMAFADLINGVTLAQHLAWAKADATRAAGGKADGPASGPGEGGCGDSGPGGAGPGGAGPGDARPRDSGPGDGCPGDGCPGGAGPGGAGPGGAGPGGAGPGGAGPGGAGPGDGCPGDGEPGDTPPPEDQGDGRAEREPPEHAMPSGEAADTAAHGAGEAGTGGPCSACGGAGRGIALAVRASLTVPAGALEWLAEWSTGHAGSGAGGGGPGSAARDRPGPCPTCLGQGSDSMPVREYLAFPLITLLGLAGRPGEAHGLGALEPAIVRDLAMAGARHPGSQFCLTITDEHGHAIGHGCCKPMRGKKGRTFQVRPDRATISRSGRAGPPGGYGSWIITLPGAPLPFTTDIHPVPTYDCDHRYESAGHDPGRQLRHLIQVRDGKCSFPACSRNARESDFEHALPYLNGGKTCGCNGHCCSRSCHRAKQSRGWQVTKPRPGWTRWTTMAGRVYEQGPWQYPT